MNSSAVCWMFRVVLVSICLLAMNPVFSYAAEVKIVRVHAQNENMGILQLSPSTLNIDKDTVVIWLNDLENGKEIMVNFRDGKSCMDVTLAPAHNGFNINAKSCYVTSFVPYLGTSSLKFVEYGVFEYAVIFNHGKIRVNGKIIVRER